MIAMRKRLELRTDEGVSLVEVLVAMMVFTVIALGVGASLLILVRMTEDTRSRLVASNLATSEIDRIRLADPVTVTSGSTSREVSGKTYTAAWSTSWVDVAGTDVGCGASSDVMRSKRVNVTVTWDGMLSTTKPVRSDTLVSPEDGDPSLGTIRVSVRTAAGTGSAGVAVTIKPTTSGGALEKAPPATDASGCSYALKVKPGTYSVAISRPSSVNETQEAAPSQSIQVTAGSSVAAQFQYDSSATFNLKYASNYAGAMPRLPENLDTSFVSTYGIYVQSGRQAQVALHPFTSGYVGVAGKYATAASDGGCLSVDPAAWTAATVNNVALAAGKRTPNVGAAPGGQVNMDIPMGVVSVKTTADLYVFAVPATAPAAAAAPGCAVSTTYAFGKLPSGTNVLALPYGSWTFKTSTTSSGSSTTVSTSNISVLAPTARAIVGSNVTTLDPRLPK